MQQALISDISSTHAAPREQRYDNQNIYVIATMGVAPACNSQATGSADQQLLQAITGGGGEILFISHGQPQITRAIEHLIANTTAPAATETAEMATAQQSPHKENTPYLTPRELDVIHMVARGFTSRDIAKMLNMSCHTVHSHLKHIYRKLSVNSRSEAVFEATRLGIIHPHDHS